MTLSGTGIPGGEADQRPPFRFSLRGLFKLIFYCCIVLGIFCLLKAAISMPREVPRRSMCINNLKMIGVALQQYHDDYGCFPAPSIVDEHGMQMHSWRAALQPYVEDCMGRGFYEKYDFNQPWNSPANIKAAQPKQTYVKPYVCPSAGQAQGQAFTNYVMVVGAETASRPGEWMSLDRITDGPSRTVLVAEIADSDIFWTEPRDLSFDEMSFQVNDETRTCISSRHTRQGRRLAAVLFADGTVKMMDESTAPKELRAMLTSAAGD